MIRKVALLRTATLPASFPPHSATDLVRSVFQLSQSHFVSRLQIQDLVSLASQQRLECQDERQVRCRRDVIMPFHLFEIANRRLTNAFVEKSAHLDTIAPYFVVHVHVFEELCGDFLQGIFWPLGEPINCAAIDQRWKHSDNKESYCHWATVIS